MSDMFKNVPQHIKDEAESVGLRLCCLWGGQDNPSAVGTEDFVQKENKDKIKKLVELGWTKYYGTISCGKKYVTYKKEF
jgi:hypothetical protein